MKRSLTGLLLACSMCGAQAPSADSGVLEEVVTTATKKSEAEIVQFVPAAISVLSGEALAARHVTDMEDLSYALPNVALDAIDEPGFSLVDWQHFIVEANRRVALGRGSITNEFGWRTVQADSLTDVDGTVDPVFHGFTFTDQEQFSNELRYSGWFRDGWQATLWMRASRTRLPIR